MFESASVLALWPEHGSGIVRGRPEIERFFAGVFELNKDVFAEWYRTGTYFTDGRVLIWEYPRQTPNGQQAGLVESMDLDDSRQITAHRVYWGRSKRLRRWAQFRPPCKSSGLSGPLRAMLTGNDPAGTAAVPVARSRRKP